MLEEAYQTGQLKGRQITDAKRLIEKRRQNGPKSASGRAKLPASTYSLVKSYQKEVARQHSMVLKAEHAQQRLLLVIQGLKSLFADENFVTLLRAEGLDTLPKYLAERVQTARVQTV
jgi:ParB family transcriptional regulator, chromosome partitioning protein